MATNTQAMQIAGQRIDRGVVRHYPADTNLKAMSMGSWKASLSRDGQAFPVLKGGRKGQGALAEKKKGAK